MVGSGLNVILKTVRNLKMNHNTKKPAVMCSHECDSTQKVNLKDYYGTMDKLPVTDEQFKQIIKFYVFHNPAAKHGPKKNDAKLNNAWSLGNNGAISPKKMEKLLLEASGIPAFNIIKAPVIKNTLKAMNLDENEPICIEHPRAVMEMIAKPELMETGEVKITTLETRMRCLFRHVRNSFAHGLVYVFDNGFILMEDRGDKKRITARILMPADTLLKWMEIMESHK